MNASQLINQDSGDVEYYSPPEIVAAARLTLGGEIDLDPASSEIANKIVMAKNFYSRDGLNNHWFGMVWMNHPFIKGQNHLWINKMVAEYRAKNVKAALCITYASTSEKWFQPLLHFPQCFLSPRTNYYLPDGTKKSGVTKGSVVTYFGKETKIFAEAFREFGTVKVAFI